MGVRVDNFHMSNCLPALCGHAAADFRHQAIDGIEGEVLINRGVKHNAEPRGKLFISPPQDHDHGNAGKSGKAYTDITVVLLDGPQGQSPIEKCFNIVAVLLYQGIKGKAVRPLEKAFSPLKAADCHKPISKGYLPSTH